MGAYLSLTITELPAACLAAGPVGNPVGTAVRTVWCHLPAGWVVDGALRPCRRRILLESIQASTDPDTASPVVLHVRERVLSEHQTRDRPWLGDRADFRRYAEDGSHRPVPPEEL